MERESLAGCLSFHPYAAHTQDNVSFGKDNDGVYRVSWEEEEKDV